MGFRAVFIAILLLVVPSAWAKSPQVRAHLTGANEVEVRWNLNTKAKRVRGAVLQMKREDESGNSSVVAYLVSPRKRSRLIDSLSGKQGRVAYRLRLYRKGKWSRWSNESVVDIGASATSPVPRSGVDSPTTGLPAGFTRCGAGEVEEVIRFTNLYRMDTPILTNHPLLAQSAFTRAVRIATQGALSHEGWFETVIASGYQGSTVGENVGFRAITAENIVAAWMGSAPHAANIRNTRYRDIGVGCVIDPSGTKWWVQNFGG